MTQRAIASVVSATCLIVVTLSLAIVIFLALPAICDLVARELLSMDVGTAYRSIRPSL